MFSFSRPSMNSSTETISAILEAAEDGITFIAELLRARGAQRSTMGKKMWLSIHPDRTE